MAFQTKTLNPSVTVVEKGGDSVSLDLDSANPSVTWKFWIRGAGYVHIAYQALWDYLGTNFLDDDGNIASYNLPLSSTKVTTTDSPDLHEAEVVFQNDDSDSSINDSEYEQPEIQDLDYSYSTTGGSRHMTHSLETLGAATTDGSTPRNFGGGIGWNGESFDGCDVVSPKNEFSIAVNWPKTHFTQAVRLALANATGCINSAAWNGYAAGCCLFKGVSAQPVAFDYSDANGNSIRDYYWRATYSFEAAPAQTIPVGSTTLTKRGFDYVWRVVERVENTSTGQIEASVAQVNVERVYPEFDFANLGLPLPE